MAVYNDTTIPIDLSPVPQPCVLEVRIRRVSENVAVIELKGEVDVYSCLKFRTAMEDLIAQGHHHLVINLASVNLIDSAGLSILITGVRQVQEYQGTLCLVSPVPAVQRALEITRLSTILNVYSTENEALSSCQAQQTLARSLQKAAKPADDVPTEG